MQYILLLFNCFIDGHVNNNLDSVDSTNGFMVKFILTILITFILVIDLRAEQSAGQTINELKGTIGKVHCK